MFQVSIYKLFNPDLRNLNNQQLHAHWKVKGIKEQRIYNYDSFYAKYPTFDLEKYKKTSSIDLQHKDNVSIMMIYHINQQANIQEEKQENNSVISHNSIKNDLCLNSNFNSSSIDTNNNSNKKNSLIFTREHSEKSNSKDSIFSSIVGHIFNNNNKTPNNNFQILDNHIDTIFIINQNIHLSKTLNFLNSYYQIKHPLVIYILSIENIDIYKELYKNIVVIYVPFIHNQYVNYYLQKICSSQNILIFLSKIPLIHQFYQTLDSYLQIKDVSYIYLGENIHIIKNYLTFPSLFISESLFSYISTVNQYNYVFSNQFSSSNIISRIHHKFINLFQRNEEKKVNRHNRNILIDYKITSWEGYLSFFYLLQFCEENQWNLFLKNGQSSFFDKFHELDMLNNVNNCENFNQFQQILNNNESFESNQICQNLKIIYPFYDHFIQYNSFFNKYLHFSDIEYILQKIYFINFQKKIIGLYIDSNNYQEQYIFNTLSSLPFEDAYLLIFCEDTTFLENNEFLQSFSFLDIKQLEHDIFEKNYILLQYFLICDYLIINHNFIALIFSYLSITTNIFLPQIEDFNFENNSTKNKNNKTKMDNDISFLIQNYNYYKVQLVNVNDHFLNKKICLYYIFQNYYVHYDNQFILWKDPFTYVKKNMPIIYLNLYMLNMLKIKYSLTLSYQIYDFLTLYKQSQNKNDIQINENNNFSHSIFIFEKNKQLFLSYFQKIMQLSEEEEDFCYLISMFFNKNKIYKSSIHNDSSNLMYYQPLFTYPFCFIITTSSYFFEYTIKQIIQFHMNDKYHFLIYLEDIYHDSNDNHSDINNLGNINNSKYYQQKKQDILCNLDFDHLSPFIDICILPSEINPSLESILIYSQFCVKLSCETLLIKIHINKLSLYIPSIFLFYYCFKINSDDYNILLMKDIFSFNINHDENNIIMNSKSNNKDYGKYNDEDINKNIITKSLLIKDKVQLPFSIDYFLYHNYLYNLKQLNHNTILKYLVFLHESKNNYNVKDNILDYINESLLYYKNQLDKNYSLKLNYYNDKKHKCSKQILDLMNINIIHISHRKDKLKNIIQEMLKHNIDNFQFFKAIIPSNLDIQHCSFIQRDLLLSPMNEKYIIGSVGCKMSHISLLESIQRKYQLKQEQLNNTNYDPKYETIPELKNYHEYALILEDDVCFDLHFQIYLELGLKALIHQFDNHFDLLYLSVNLEKKEDAELVHPFLLRILHGFTTTAYIVKLNNIDKIVNTLYNSKEEIDKVYSESDLIKYCICPMIAYQNNMKSDISYVANGYGNYHEKFEFCE